MSPSAFMRILNFLPLLPPYQTKSLPILAIFVSGVFTPVLAKHTPSGASLTLR